MTAGAMTLIIALNDAIDPKEVMSTERVSGIIKRLDDAGLIVGPEDEYSVLVDALREIATGGYRYPHEVAMAALEKIGKEVDTDG